MATNHLLRLMGGGLLCLLAACTRQSCTPAPDGNGDAPPAASGTSSPGQDTARTRRCFSVVAKDNSPSTRAVFEAKHCQGGGVTWAGILRVLVHRRGTSKAVEAETPGWTGDVRTLSWEGGSTRVAIDDEADAALFCADSQRLVDEIRSDVKRLNARAGELERAMGEANPFELECLPDDASLSALMNGLNPSPPPSPAEARAREDGLARMRAVLAKQRTWCWGPGGAAFGGKGGFTLHENGQAASFGDGATPRDGRWTLGQDGRVEVILPGGLHHFDAGENGRLGFNHTAGREELQPCVQPR
ncbi:MAG: hypothetical protein J0I07_03260 [Myxococcales bacterium]|nr:hypothetical protein [Myxococcales bacterium]